MSPVPHAHVTTTTTHKSLRGPRSGIILTNDEALAKKFNSAIFPGLQGGPLVHIIAAKAVAFGEALTPEFKAYARQVKANAHALATSLQAEGLGIVSGGTDNHLMLVDLRPFGAKGKHAEHALDRAAITCNKNSIPFDSEKPLLTSGIRLGTPAGTTRGFGEAEFTQIGKWIAEVVAALGKNGAEGDAQIEARVEAQCRNCAPTSRSIPTWPTEDQQTLRCPFCAHDNTQVKDSRPAEDNTAIRRRRQCENCGGRFSTFERVQLREVFVIKSGAPRTPPLAANPSTGPRSTSLSRWPAANAASLRSGSTSWSGHPAPDRDHGRKRSRQPSHRRDGDGGLRQLDSVAYIRFASSIAIFRSARFRGIRQQCPRYREPGS
jgi:transcription elongation factor Elf1